MEESICSPSPIPELDPLLVANLLSEKDLILQFESNMSSKLTNFSTTEAGTASQIPAAVMIPTGILLYVLSFLTFVGNAMVLHAIRTDKRLQTVPK